MSGRKQGEQILFLRPDESKASVEIYLEKGGMVRCVFATEAHPDNTILHDELIPSKAAEEIGRVLQRFGCTTASAAESTLP